MSTRSRSAATTERNLVRAGMVRQAWDYLWSSAAAPVNGSDTTGILDLAAWRVPPAEWHRQLQQREDDDFLSGIRTSTGRPLATDSTLSRLEALLNKRLRPLPGRRPARRRGWARGAARPARARRGRERIKLGKLGDCP